MLKSTLIMLAAMAAAPLLAAITGRVKAWLAGRRGPAWTLNYATLAKLLRKTPVYSRSTTYVFRLGPLVGLATILAALAFLPIAGRPPIFSFAGDVVFVFYLLGLGRFFVVAAALDTASPFEGMGAAREALFGTLAEATVFMVLFLLQQTHGGMSLATSLAATTAGPGMNGAALVLAVIALFMILLTENSRVPVDDPTTHLELTMIHEVMILDHSGPDLAMIEMGGWLKLLFYATFIADIACPFRGGPGDYLLYLLALVVIYGGIGLVESITARFRMSLVPKFILTSFALAFFALIFTMEMPG